MQTKIITTNPQITKNQTPMLRAWMRCTKLYFQIRIDKGNLLPTTYPSQTHTRGILIEKDQYSLEEESLIRYYFEILPWHLIQRHKPWTLTKRPWHERFLSNVLSKATDEDDLRSRQIEFNKQMENTWLLSATNEVNLLNNICAVLISEERIDMQVLEEIVRLFYPSFVLRISPIMLKGVPALTVFSAGNLMMINSLFTQGASIPIAALNLFIGGLLAIAIGLEPRSELNPYSLLKKVGTEEFPSHLAKGTPENLFDEIFLTYILYGDSYRNLDKGSVLYKAYCLMRDKVFLGTEYTRDAKSKPVKIVRATT